MEIPIEDHHHYCREERDEYGPPPPCGCFRDEYSHLPTPYFTSTPPPAQYVGFQIPVQDAVYDHFVDKPTVRVYTKAQTSYSLAIRDGQVILALSNAQDPTQHWYKDEKYSTTVKDKEGYPSFALVNKATGQAIKHSIGGSQPVRLVPYNPNVLDESILWTESKDVGAGYRCIRMVNNILLNMDAFHGDKKHRGVRDGTVVVVWEWAKGDNQRWKIDLY